MAYRMMATLCVVVLSPALAAAQGTKPQEQPRSLEQLARDVQALQAQLKTTNENLTLVTEGLKTTNESVDEIRADIVQLRADVQEQQARQQQILDSIVQDTNRQRSDEVRQEVRRAVQESLTTHGEFTIHNRMTTRQQIVVNQSEYGLDPDEILTLKVPVGTVTARLPGQPLTNWTVGAPAYRQRVDIVPDANATTTYRPLSSGTVVTPWYSLSPVQGESYLTPLPPPPPIYVAPLTIYR